MELALGTEPTNRYLSFEVARAARKLVEEVMLVKPGENVLVTVDTAGDRRVAEAVAEAAYAAGAVPTLVVYHTSPTAVVEPPAPVAGAAARAQVWIELAVAYVLHTDAYRNARRQGAAIFALRAWTWTCWYAAWDAWTTRPCWRWGKLFAAWLPAPTRSG
ncbi:MAG: hypothetical protein AB1446_06585 [Bacillota bacterium]